MTKSSFVTTRFFFLFKNMLIMPIQKTLDTLEMVERKQELTDLLLKVT